MTLSKAAVWRVLRSLLAAELAALREQPVSTLSAENWQLDEDIHKAPLALDSLEHLQLAAAANRFFHLHASGLEDYLLRYARLEQWVELILTARERSTGTISVMTSGSSGEQRLCTHSWTHLMREVDYFAEQFADRQRIVLDCPPHHLYGFIFGALLADRLGLEVIERHVLGNGGTLADGDLVVGFPQRWQFMLASQVVIPADCKAVSSTAPCPSVLMQKLRDRFVSVTEVYGASETSGLAVRTEAGPYQLLPHWQRCGDTQVVTELLGAVALPDVVEWHDETQFSIQRRLDGAVQVGGVNVYPDHVASVMAASPLVAECTVRPYQAQDQLRLKIFVVAADDSVTESQLREYAAQELRSVERPQQYAFGETIPRNEMGKLCDWVSS
jgi:4-coumarate--CoA ligase (photoactive yellow protein activation family)